MEIKVNNPIHINLAERSVRKAVWGSVGDSALVSVRGSVGDSVVFSLRNYVGISVNDAVVVSVAGSVWVSMRGFFH